MRKDIPNPFYKPKDGVDLDSQTEISSDQMEISADLNAGEQRNPNHVQPPSGQDDKQNFTDDVVIMDGDDQTLTTLL